MPRGPRFRKSTIAFASVAVAVLIGMVAVTTGRESSTPGGAEKTAQQSVVESVAKGEEPASNAGSQTGVQTEPTGFDWEAKARSVVYIEARGTGCEWSGSGSIVLDGSYVLTNHHVSGDGECSLSIWLTDSTSEAPTRQLTAEIVLYDVVMDLAVLRMVDSSGRPFLDPTRTPMTLASGVPKLGDKLTILGYPGLGGSTITLTSGDYSGLDKSDRYDYLKTTANMNPGVSGGAALNARGELVGIPTAGRGAEIACGNRNDCVANGSTIGLLRPVSLARDLLSGVPG